MRFRCAHTGHPGAARLCKCHLGDTQTSPTCHVSAVLDAEEHAPWPPVHVVVVDGSPANGWRVHNWRDLAEVVDQQLVEQRLVAVLYNDNSGSASTVRMRNAVTISDMVLAPIVTNADLQLRQDAPLAYMIPCHRRVLQINPVLAEEIVICTPKVQCSSDGEPLS
jgi:hypothetical protein